MNGYSIQLTPRSPWASPWHADTLFGCLAWAWNDLYGSDDLEDLLDLFGASKPPFVLSDAFPGDLLPFPAGVRADSPPSDKKKALWISQTEFRRFAQGEKGPLRIALAGDSPLQEVTRLHASLDRLTDSTAGGQLFEIDMHQLAPEFRARHLTLYFRCKEEWKDRLLQALEAVSWRGFGKKASSGLGAFRVDGPEQTCELLAERKGANGFMALSHFLPAASDPVDGAWRLKVKHPKFQSNMVQLFLKGTFLLLQPGSTFRTVGTPQPWYGRAHKLAVPEFPKAIQYGMTMAAPVVLPESWRNSDGG